MELEALPFRHYEIQSLKLCLHNKNNSCRSLVYRLEEADPKRMKHEEKLAFWINVHNALVMHVMSLKLKKYSFLMICVFCYKSMNYCNSFIIFFFVFAGIFGLRGS